MSASSWPEAVPAVTIEEAPAPAEAVRWSLPTRIAFRFCFSYFVLYNLPAVLELFPMQIAMTLWGKYQELWQSIVRPVGTTVFGVVTDVLPNGSGDTTFNYVQVFVMAAVALAATIVWSIADRRRLAYPTLYAWFRTYVRFALAMVMVGYGVVKVIKLQFGTLLLDRLMQPFGEASPMGLLWTFMSFSVLYNVFTGAGEMLGGILLTTRRTALLGALVTAGVMTHVVVLNFSYDVPVKLYSTHLLFMALIIAAPDAARLANMFVLNRPVPPAPLRPRFRNRWMDVASRAARTILVIAFVTLALQGSMARMEEWKRTPVAEAPLYGVWNVDELRVNGVERPPLTTDRTRLRRLIVSSDRVVALERMDDKRLRYMMTNTPTLGTLALKRNSPPASVGTFAYTRPDQSTLILEGTLDDQKIVATLRKAPTPEFQLTTRGFHWINEYPYNR
jgi:hypothetical protein